jgi:hypothetical protein
MNRNERDYNNVDNRDSQNNKKTSKEIIQIDARLNELERCRPYLDRKFYRDRTESLYERKNELQKKIEIGKLAPDIQYIITEVYDNEK